MVQEPGLIFLNHDPNKSIGEVKNFGLKPEEFMLKAQFDPYKILIHWTLKGP